MTASRVETASPPVQVTWLISPRPLSVPTAASLASEGRVDLVNLRSVLRGLSFGCQGSGFGGFGSIGIVVSSPPQA